MSKKRTTGTHPTTKTTDKGVNAIRALHAILDGDHAQAARLLDDDALTLTDRHNARAAAAARDRFATNALKLTISRHVWSVLGLDDMGRYTDVRRTCGGLRVVCQGPRDALQDLVDEIHDRATEGEGGYNESASAKLACRRVLAQLRVAGWAPRT